MSVQHTLFQKRCRTRIAKILSFNLCVAILIRNEATKANIFVDTSVEKRSEFINIT